MNLIRSLAGGCSWLARNPRQRENFGVTRPPSPSDPPIVLAYEPYLESPLFALFPNLGHFLTTATGLAGSSY